MILNRLMSGVAALSMAAVVSACGNQGLQSVTGPTATGGSSASHGGGSALSLAVTCETRNSRSRISVDARNVLAGSYTARVASGANTAASPARLAVGDEVEFDFDSNPADVAAGATAISATFISGDKATAQLVNGAGAVIASASATCRTR